MFFVTQLLVIDGLFFWGALFGLQFNSSMHSGFPVQLVLLAGLLRLVGGVGWVWSMSRDSLIPASELDSIHNRWLQLAKHALIGAPGVLLVAASGHKLDHRRITMDTWMIALVLLLSVLPIWAALGAVCFNNTGGWSLTALGDYNWRRTWREIDNDPGGRHDGHEGKKTVSAQLARLIACHTR